MSKRSLYSLEEKYQVISEVMDGRHSVNSITKKHFLPWTTIKDWIRKYTDDGIEGLKKSTVWKRYESDLKQKIPLVSKFDPQSDAPNPPIIGNIVPDFFRFDSEINCR